MGSIPGPGRSLREGNDNLLQYSCLGNSMYRGAWQFMAMRLQKSWTQLSDQTATSMTYMGMESKREDICTHMTESLCCTEETDYCK